MIKFRNFDIWYAKCVFEDNPHQSKDRPVLIVGGEQGTFVLALMITGTQRCDGNDYVVRDWQEAGLTKASVIRTRKKYSLPEIAFRRRVGRLSDNDILILRIMFGSA
jgi:mRNA-degrading endonuclease toxin of MazEF toxin-antitoxin module